jgi:hypothetical protein
VTAPMPRLAPVMSTTLGIRTLRAIRRGAAGY